MTQNIEGVALLTRKDVSEIVNAAIDHAVLGLKYWVVLGILLNGIPTVLVGGAFYFQLTETIKLAKDTEQIVDGRRKFMNDTAQDIKDMQDYLKDEHGYVPREKVSDKYR